MMPEKLEAFPPKVSTSPRAVTTAGRNVILKVFIRLDECCYELGGRCWVDVFIMLADGQHELMHMNPRVGKRQKKRPPPHWHFAVSRRWPQ